MSAKVKAQAQRNKKLEQQAQALDGPSSSSSSSASSEDAATKKKDIRLANKDYVNLTPVGEKKDMSGPIADAYDPPAVESAWYSWWEKQGYFSPSLSPDASSSPSDPKQQFVMVLPPPNVTGRLHAGHALMSAVEDALTRWHRMNGHTTLWVPGTDHAGIATQCVVEKKLAREQKPSRLELGREAFTEEVWKWKNESGGAICHQMRRLGVSVDWTRESFTMDEPRSAAVVEAFVRLYESGRIYRATRLVNWCCALKSAISDIEVDTIEASGRTQRHVPGYDRTVLFGVIDHFGYPVLDSEEVLVVATTRLETMLGDTAVAIHPNDPRYTHLHGKFVKHPFTGRELPIICDPVLVDMGLGTGVVKVTPAHDPHDYECGKRNNLPFISILNPDGTLNEHCGPFAGMKRYDAREAVRKQLEQLGLFRERKDHTLNIPICSRTGDVIEPCLVPQWYFDVSELAARALEASETGALEIIPEFEKDSWRRWLSTPQPWCISRQLWWGHRIPAFLIWKKGEPRPDPARPDVWIVARTMEQAIERARLVLSDIESPDQLEIEQDTDVLDTWFSSGLLPFSNLGWPNTEHPDFRRFFPTTLLETGSDILFFWVARMVMMSLALTDTLPFKQVFLHPMVRDAHGRKMSKASGNVIDPIDIIQGITLDDLQELLKHGNLDPRELKISLAGQKKDFPSGISECGTDALRFALCLETGHSRSVNLSVDKVASIRNWCNKLWNALRFATSMFPADWKPSPTPFACGSLSFIDQWIASRLNACVASCTRGFEQFLLCDAAQSLYRFLYNDFCDVYLEAVKPVFWKATEAAQVSGDNTSPPSVVAASETLYTCIEIGMRLLHPFMPFLTEELWQRLPLRPDATVYPSIMISPWPTALPGITNPQVEREMEIIQEICHTLRSIRSQYGLVKQRPNLFIRPLQPELTALLTELSPTIDRLGSVNNTLVFTDASDVRPPPGCCISSVGHHCELHVSLKGLVDFEKEIQRLVKSKERVEREINSITSRLEKPAYIARAKPELIEKDNESLAQKRAEMQVIDDAIESMRQLEKLNLE